MKIMNSATKPLLLALTVLLAFLFVGATPARAQSNVSWVRTGTATAHGYRVAFEVRFNQQSTAGSAWRVTTCDVVLTRFQVRVLPWVWADVSPGVVASTGSFSGPRSPLLMSGASGYIKPNPYSVVGHIGTSLRHFVDESPIWMSPYTMTHGIYSFTAFISATTYVKAEVVW